MRKSDGVKIRLLRQEAGVGVTALSKRVQCSRQHLTNVESGAFGASIELLNRIATELSVSVDDLMVTEQLEAA